MPSEVPAGPDGRDPPEGEQESESGGGPIAGAGALSVAIVAEQLRRRVPGGIGTYVSCLVRALAGLTGAPRLTLIAGRERHGPTVGEQIGDGIHIPVSGPRLPTELLTRLWDHGLLGVGAEGRRADVVHATSMGAPRLTSATRGRARGGGKGPVFTAMVHDLAWRRFPESFPRRGRRWHEDSLHRLARQATAVVVPSEQTAADLAAAAVGWDRAQITVIPEGADHLPPPDGAAAAAALRRLGVRGDYLLTVGTLEPRKNLARLIAAYSAARSFLPETLPLVVVGPAGWGGSIAPTAGVVLAGRLDEPVLSALYASARLVAYVPVTEGFGLPAVEAMLAGAPVVASSGVPSAAQAIPTVDPLDVDAIASALVKAATDDVWRAQLVAAGRRHAGSLSWAETAKRHLAWWTGLRSG